ncbi:hypothetical protein BOX15_Mlig011471g3, partial [Macrostomum lignano]
TTMATSWHPQSCTRFNNFWSNYCTVWRNSRPATLLRDTSNASATNSRLNATDSHISQQQADLRRSLIDAEKRYNEHQISINRLTERIAALYEARLRLLTVCSERKAGLDSPVLVEYARLLAERRSADQIGSGNVDGLDVYDQIDVEEKEEPAVEEEEENLLHLDKGYAEFLRQSEAHRHRRDAAIGGARQPNGNDDGPTETVESNPGLLANSLPPTVQPGLERTIDMRRLYGRHAAIIQGMETAMQMRFDQACDSGANRPVYWPSMPLRPQF